VILGVVFEWRDARQDCLRLRFWDLCLGEGCEMGLPMVVSFVLF